MGRGFTEIELQQPSNPLEVLNRERSVQPEPVSLGGDDGRIQAETGEMIARSQPCEEQSSRRHHHDQQNGGGGSPDDEPEQSAHADLFGWRGSRRYRRTLSVTASVSALHSSCGMSGAGVALVTRGDNAIVTFGATKYKAGTCSPKTRCTSAKRRCRSARVGAETCFRIRSSTCASQSVAGFCWPGFQKCVAPELSQKSRLIAGSVELAWNP